MHSRTTYECYHYVKAALYRSGMARPGSLTGRAASQAVSDLRRQGFTNLLDNPKYAYMRGSPERAPIGAVVVYASRIPKYSNGDVQIHAPDGWISDYFSKNAMIRQWNGRDFYVLGIMTKPGT
jgi:hypothetical protein